MSPQKRGIPIGSVGMAPSPFFRPNLCIMHAQSTFPKRIQSYENSATHSRRVLIVSKEYECGRNARSGAPPGRHIWLGPAWRGVAGLARTTSASTTFRKFYGYMRTADPIGTAYDRLLQSMQTYRSTQLSFFRGIGRSGRRTPSHSQHCSGSLVVVSMVCEGIGE
jgi:hypothetical protein